MSKIINHPARLEQCVEHVIDCPAKCIVQGATRAGSQTGFFIKPWNIILDAGFPSYRTANAIFITHSHADHTLALPMLVSRRTKLLKGQEHLRGTPIYCPQKITHKIHLLHRAVYELSYDDFPRNECTTLRLSLSKHVRDIIYLELSHNSSSPFPGFQI